MKRLLITIITTILILMISVMPISAYSAQNMSEYGQGNYNVYKTSNPPIADGIVKDNEYGTPIAVLNNGDSGVYWNGEKYEDSVLEKILPKDMTFYLTYDDKYLYVGVTMYDESHYTPGSGTDIWDGDYLEFDISTLVGDSFDDMRDRTRIAAGINNDGETCIYFASTQSDVSSSIALNTPLDTFDGMISRNESTKITTYELIIPWEDISPTGNVPDKAYMYIQAGVSHEEYYDLSDYVAYLGVFRHAALLSDEMNTETGGAAVFHIGTFAGDPPIETIVYEETEVSATETSATETFVANQQQITISPQTNDKFIIVFLILIISAGGVVINKKFNYK